MVDGLRRMGRRRHIGAAGLVILACLLYLPTVQPDISASGYAFLMAWLNDRVAAVLAASVLGVGWVFWLHSSS